MSVIIFSFHFQPELIRSHGYQVEIHNVITEDGYILEIHRLPCGRLDCERNFTNGKQPILMQHGLAGSSADWVFMGPNRALGNYAQHYFPGIFTRLNDYIFF